MHQTQECAKVSTARPYKIQNVSCTIVCKRFPTHPPRATAALARRQRHSWRLAAGRLRLGRSACWAAQPWRRFRMLSPLPIRATSE